MIGRLKSRWSLVGGAVVALLVVASAALAPLVWPQLATADVAVPISLAVNAAAPSGRQTAMVQRGPIAELLPLSGRVGGLEEVAVSFPTPSSVESVAVEPGQAVEQGQLLLQGESKAIEKQRSEAQARLEAASLRLGQAQARQREVERRTRLDLARQQSLVREAEAEHRRAQAALERVKAGPSLADRRAAEAAVAAARTGLARAESDLARLTAGPGAAESRAAEQQVAAARLAQQRAEAEHARATGGPDPTEVRTAERELAGAQAEVERAQAELDRQSQGPDPNDLRAAEREVERAQNALRAAEAMKADDITREAREATIANARLGLQDAQDRLARVREGPRPWEVGIARSTLQLAQLRAELAQERLDRVRKGPDQAAIDTANAAVENARASLESAQAHLQALQAGAPADQVETAKSAVADARAALDSASARLDELNTHPTPAELQEAEDRVAASGAALERARAEAEPPPENSDPGAFDVLALQKSVDQDQAQVDALERQLAATRLLAPFAGVVAAVHVRPGDPLEPGSPAVVLARPGDLVVRAEVADRLASRLAVGQAATVQLEGMEGAPLSASVASLAATDSGLGPVALLQVAWPTERPLLGTAAQVVVTVQQKDSALLVPQRAVHSAGPRRYVEYLEGASRRLADVQVGITTAGQAEILSGLSEGQQVLLGS
ncbi:MAG: HlyD family efflux transporter periplasmic adaptor subunit [Chloroflexi bacterium]|nr:HlyD family efflux transporter periplasmic adaptor subunit [Chloroflexota bacterium]